MLLENRGLPGDAARRPPSHLRSSRSSCGRSTASSKAIGETTRSAAGASTTASTTRSSPICAAAPAIPRATPTARCRRDCCCGRRFPTTRFSAPTGTYGPKANFKISLRELPDDGRFRVTVMAAKYNDGLLLDPGTPSQTVRTASFGTITKSSGQRHDPEGGYLSGGHSWTGARVARRRIRRVYEPGWPDPGRQIRLQRGVWRGRRSSSILRSARRCPSTDAGDSFIVPRERSPPTTR